MTSPVYWVYSSLRGSGLGIRRVFGSNGKGLSFNNFDAAEVFCKNLEERFPNLECHIIVRGA